MPSEADFEAVMESLRRGTQREERGGVLVAWDATTLTALTIGKGWAAARVASVNLVPLLWTGVPTSGRQEPLPMFRCPGLPGFP